MPSWDDDWQPDPGDSGSPGFLRRRAPGIREYQADPWSRAASLAAIWAAGPLAGVGYLIVRNYAGANLHCLADAIQTASTRAPAAIWQETGLGNLGGLLAGIIDGMLKALAVIAASGLLGAAAGGAVGFFFFGAGGRARGNRGGEARFGTRDRRDGVARSGVDRCGDREGVG